MLSQRQTGVLGAFDIPWLTSDSIALRLILAITLIATVGCGSTRQSAGTASATSSGGSTTPPMAGPVLAASNSNLTFGNVQVGTSTAQLITLTNTGHSALNISAISASGSEFTASGSSNMMLSPNQSANVYVNFVPTAAGSTAGTVTITSNSITSMAPISISGVGVTSQSTGHDVALSWTPSSSNIVGYFIDRSNVMGGPYTRLNATADSDPTYTDTGLTSGSYFYVVTSVDSNNVESVYSNEVQAVIL